MGLIPGGESMNRTGYDVDERSLFAEPEASLPAPLSELVRRFKNDGPNTMTDGEMSTIDQAVEDRLISEDSLRSSPDAS